MPIIKSAIKRVKQDKVKTARNRHYSSHMKSMIRLILEYVQKGEADKANKIFTKVISSIDTCSKKNIIHNNNASRKKSRIQKALNNIGAPKAEKPAKAEKAEKKADKKVEKAEKVEEKVEEKTGEKAEKAEEKVEKKEEKTEK